MKGFTASTLKLPQQDLDSFTHFSPEPAAADKWLDALPLGNAVKSASALRSALSDLNRLELKPLQRFNILEILRPALLQLSTALSNTYLGQSLVLSDEDRRHSEMVADLYELGAAGYSLVAVHTIRGKDALVGINPARLACESLQRAVHLHGMDLLHYYTLYQPPPLNQWATLHSLYALAERQQLASLPVTDPITEEKTSIRGEYVANLVFGCSKTNQMRQVDIVAAHRAMRQWRDLASIEDPEFGSGMFIVDLSEDMPPSYATLRPGTAGPSQRYLNTEGLVRHINVLRNRRGGESGTGFELDRGTRLDNNVLSHLARALGQVSQRNFSRQSISQPLWIANGLTAVHYFVAGEKSLMEVLHGPGYVPAPGTQLLSNPFLAPRSRSDSWQQANPEEDFDPGEAGEVAEGIDVDTEVLARLHDLEKDSTPKKHEVFAVQSANVSPSGYCVEWTGLPDGIHIGDVVCLREQGQQEGDWYIAVIRWISQVKNAPTLLGMELLSPRGTAYAAEVKMADGEYSPPIRVIVMPEIPLVGQPHTVLAPRLVFKENQRIVLARKDEKFLIKLKRLVASTAAFGQFDFEYMRQIDDDVAASSGDPLKGTAFESIWSDI